MFVHCPEVFVPSYSYFQRACLLTNMITFFVMVFCLMHSFFCMSFASCADANWSNCCDTVALGQVNLQKVTAVFLWVSSGAW